MFDIFTEEENLEFEKGLSLTGWYVDCRATTDDLMRLKSISERALELNPSNEDYAENIEKLSIEVFHIVVHYLSNPADRAALVSYGYEQSSFFSGTINMIEESICAYYSGFHTAALSLLFISLESYLRNLSGWKPGDKDITFKQLKNAVEKLPPNEYREMAQQIINNVYSRYDATSPALFYFNRHGLLHGLRTENNEYDQMNYLRLLSLMDLLAFSDGGRRSGVINERFKNLADKFEKYI
ncbi:hypothetical protein [Photobacterium kagoshimensis]|uniref:hypothetical protein n=1 Tax=Photobacterium kagoshimensis TaxID=2910242 RepID=UPI003D135444